MLWEKQFTLLWWSQFWLPLFVISPNGDSKINKEAYYYGDLPVSILDYLSMDQERDSFSGRSLFRNPSQNRFLFFGLERKIALFDPQNFKLIWCSRDFYSCNDYPLQNKNLFWPLKSSRPANQKYIDYYLLMIVQIPIGIKNKVLV